ncbi:glycosyltransferase family 4 protein [Pyrococcus abyssi]|nr:glycosyltransferase [Pyrococcus abyssi]CAB50501.1 Putative hexosyltransferase, glycosyltransferase family 1 [Pyrococcus abyssi GE5]
MRILMVGHYPPHRGGVARHLKEVVERLRRRHSVDVLTYGTVATDVYSVKVPNVFGLRGISFSFLASKKIVELHEERNYDLIHAHYVGTTSFAGVLAKRKLGIPLVVTAHGSDLEFMSKLPLGRYFVKASLREADAVTAVSHFLAKRAISLGAKSVEVISNGVSTCGDRVSKKYIVFLGKVSKYKGIDEFLELARRFPELEFLIAGEGNLRELPSNVKFLGYVNPDDVLSRALALVLPSKREGFGMVILEANSFSVPALGRKVGGIPELIRDGKNGFLFDSIDEAEKFLRVLLDLKVNAKVGALGKRVASLYSWDDVAIRYERLYRRVLER